MMGSSRACCNACLLLTTTHHTMSAWPLSLAKHAVLCIKAPSQRTVTVLLKAMCQSCCAIAAMGRTKTGN